MLLAIWHDLSDVKLADAFDDRASFRRFCGFARTEPTPERTAFVRFRKELLRHGLDESPFDEITAQLKAKAIWVETGTMVDATVIVSSSKGDEDARWSGIVRVSQSPRLQGACGPCGEARRDAWQCQ